MKRLSALVKQRLTLKISISLMVFILMAGCSGQPKVEFPIRVGVHPESITKGFDGNYYVTLLNEKAEGDGEVVEISGKGVKVFAKGFNDPKGMVYLNDHLYLTDVTRIWKVDKEGNASIFVQESDFPDKVYFNDVSIDAEGKGIYVSDMGAVKYMWDDNGQLWPLDSEEAKLVPPAGRIYHIDLNAGITLVQDTFNLMLNPNGVAVDNDGNLIVGAFFLGNFLVTRNNELTPLKGQYRGADGIAQDSKGDYYVSSWTQGIVWKIDGSTEESVVLIDGLKSAADFYLEEEKGRLLLPDMKEGIVYAVEINR